MFNSVLGKSFKFQQDLEKNLTHASGEKVIKALATKISFTFTNIKGQEHKVGFAYQKKKVLCAFLRTRC